MSTTCVACGQPLALNAAFCIGCGRPAPRWCIQCGGPLSVAASWCGTCGSKVGAAVGPATATVPQPLAQPLVPPAQPTPPVWGAPATVAGRPGGLMRSARRRPVLIAGAAVAVVAVLVATTVFGGRLPWNSSGIPLVETPMVAPTVIDVPTEDSNLSIAPGKGGRLDVDGISLVVPSGAATSNSTVTVRELQEPFHMTMWQSPEEAGTNPTVVGPVVDFGPEGTTFSEPVTVSIPYSQMALPAGVSEDSIVPAYWNGQTWVAVSGTVDKSADTVSVRLKDFKGSGLAPIAAVAALGAVIVGTFAYAGYHAYKWLKGDAIVQGKAKDWVTPKTDIVQQYAKQAVITDSNTHVQMSLQDPKMPAWLAAGSAQGHAMDMGYLSSDGQVQAIKHDEDGNGWQKPDDFFLKGDDFGPLNGDCTDAANSSVSVFIASRFKAKAVFGYNAEKGGAHAYAEVVIDGQLYRMDEGGLYTEKRWGELNMPTYNPPSSWDRRFNSMWDDAGQQPYNKDWWRQLKLTLDPPTTSGMTAKFKVTADGIPADVQDLSFNWDYGDGVTDGSNEITAPYTQPLSSEMSHTYTKPGDYTVKVTMYDDTAYYAIAGANPDKLTDTTVTVKIAAAGGANYTSVIIKSVYIDQIGNAGEVLALIRMTGQRTFVLDKPDTAYSPYAPALKSLTGEISADGASVTMTITYLDDPDNPGPGSCPNVTKLRDVPLVEPYSGPHGEGLSFAAKGLAAVEAGLDNSMPYMDKCLTSSDSLKGDLGGFTPEVDVTLIGR